jgi:hypothetical protein
MFNSQRLQFYPATYSPEPHTEISDSPFDVTGRQRFQLERLGRTVRIQGHAAQPVNGRRAFPCRLKPPKVGSPLR